MIGSGSEQVLEETESGPCPGKPDRDPTTGSPRSYRNGKYMLQITQPFQYKYAKLQYRFAVTSGAPSRCEEEQNKHVAE